MTRTRRAGTMFGVLLAGCASVAETAPATPSTSGSPPETGGITAFATERADAGGSLGEPPLGSASACQPACGEGLSCVNRACVGAIDFEVVPGTRPADGLSIADQFVATHGVRFGLDADGDRRPDPGRAPVLARVGAPCTAFFYADTCDTGAPNQKPGTFFLTDDGAIGVAPPALIVSYTSPVAGAYAQILDVDEPEAWTIEALDAGGMVLDQVEVSWKDANSGDGIATPFAFRHAKPDIHALRVIYSGGNVPAVGLAFDNFSPTTEVAPPGQPPALSLK